jgi:hypothetical protein
MYSAFADAKMLQFNSSYLVPNIIKMSSSDAFQKAKAIVVLGVCLSRPWEEKPPPGYRQTPIWLLWGACERITNI